MNLLKTPRIKDLAYRKSFRGQPCEASRNGIDLCGLRSVETVVGAHIRVGNIPGWGKSLRMILFWHFVMIVTVMKAIIQGPNGI